MKIYLPKENETSWQTREWNLRQKILVHILQQLMHKMNRKRVESMGQLFELCVLSCSLEEGLI